MTVEFTPFAVEDLDDLLRYYRREAGAAVADRRADAIVDALESITSHPGIGRRRPELERGREVRSFGVRPHVIFYRPSAPGILVLRILHERREIDRPLFEEGD